jgi:hypothetical protein
MFSSRHPRGQDGFNRRLQPAASTGGFNRRLQLEVQLLYVSFVRGRPGCSFFPLLLPSFSLSLALVVRCGRGQQGRKQKRKKEKRESSVACASTGRERATVSIIEERHSPRRMLLLLRLDPPGFASSLHPSALPRFPLHAHTRPPPYSIGRFRSCERNSSAARANAPGKSLRVLTHTPLEHYQFYLSRLERDFDGVAVWCGVGGGRGEMERERTSRRSLRAQSLPHGGDWRRARSKLHGVIY